MAPVVSFSLKDIPTFTNKTYIEINNNIPYFTSSDYTTTSFEKYSPLDSLGRCGIAYACIGIDLMPTEERGSIGNIKPSGWQTIKYDGIDGKYLFNRCHLIGYQLSGENANEKNLITGTRFLNTKGMLPFENYVADYVKEFHNHVLYRVTPIFEGNNLVASGVLIEALSVEDKGAGVTFCVYCYNNQPNITIDYSNGNSSANDGSSSVDTSDSNSVGAVAGAVASNNSNINEDNSNSNSHTYILNTNTMKFHLPDCSSVNKIKDKNKQSYTGSRDTLIAEGYKPCGICDP